MGSEMCIRDRFASRAPTCPCCARPSSPSSSPRRRPRRPRRLERLTVARCLIDEVAQLAEHLVLAPDGLPAAHRQQREHVRADDGHHRVQEVDGAAEEGQLRVPEEGEVPVDGEGGGVQREREERRADVDAVLGP